MTPGISSSNSSNSGSNGVAAPPVPPSSVNTNQFMQLLVAQLKNQDPLSPADGTQFLTQLAQFTELEQTVNMKSDLTAIRQAVDQLAGITTSSQSQG